MRCPQCGLVHAPKTQVCRRCEIDMQTGETRLRAVSLLKTAKKTAIKATPRKKTAEKKPGKTDHEETPEEAPPETAEAPEKQDKQKRKTGKETAEKASGRDVLEVLLPSGSGSRAPVSCIQCTTLMEVHKDHQYSRTYPLLFLALGLLLAVAGLFLNLLLLPALAAVLAGLAYLGHGGSYWLCPQCGFRIERQDKPIRDIFSPGLDRKKSQRHPAIRAVAMVFNALLLLLFAVAVIAVIAGKVPAWPALLYLLIGILVFWIIARTGAEILVRAALGRRA